MTCPRFVVAILILVTVLLVFPMGTPTCRAADLSGCWTGHWMSCSTGHQGPLRATFTKVDDTHYCAQFSGRFWKLFPFRYSTTLAVVEEGDQIKLQGSSYLGRIMGTFYYSASATDTHFSATYRSCRDHGRWVLTRCGTESCH